MVRRHALVPPRARTRKFASGGGDSPSLSEISEPFVLPSQTVWIKPGGPRPLFERGSVTTRGRVLHCAPPSPFRPSKSGTSECEPAREPPPQNVKCETVLGIAGPIPKGKPDSEYDSVIAECQNPFRMTLLPFRTEASMPGCKNPFGIGASSPPHTSDAPFAE
jgi:hypothetical protein